MEVIKFSKNQNVSLIHALADAYKEKGDYLWAYVYYLAGNKPVDVAMLLWDHIFAMGYKTEANYFILWACLEFIMHQHIDSAKKLVDSFWTEPDEN